MARGSIFTIWNFEFNSDSSQTQINLNFNSGSIQFTIVSNSNHNHFKFKSQSFQIQVRFQITFTSNPSLTQLSVKTLPVQNQLHFKFKVDPSQFCPSRSAKVRTCWLANALCFLRRSLQPDWGLDSS